MLELGCLNYVALEVDLLMLTVRERWTEKRWFRSVEHECVKDYILNTGLQRWLDGDTFLSVRDPRHLRLYELLMAKRIELGIDRLIFNDQPVIEVHGQ